MRRLADSDGEREVVERDAEALTAWPDRACRVLIEC